MNNANMNSFHAQRKLKIASVELVVPQCQGPRKRTELHPVRCPVGHLKARLACRIFARAARGDEKVVAFDLKNVFGFDEVDGAAIGIGHGDGRFCFDGREQVAKFLALGVGQARADASEGLEKDGVVLFCWICERSEN